MSLRDMFSKSKKKRSRSPTNDPSESNRSFVNNVKSRVSGLVPARISQWFSSSPKNSTKNGSTPIADSTDSSDDDSEVIPPAKRKRYNSQHNQPFQEEPAPSYMDSSDTTSYENSRHTVRAAPGRNTFIREEKYVSSRYTSNPDDSTTEPASLSSTDVETTYRSLHTSTSSGQPVATKRKSIFPFNEKTKNNEETPKKSPYISPYSVATSSGHSVANQRKSINHTIKRTKDEEETTKKSPYTTSSSGHSVATERVSIFDAIERTKDEEESSEKPLSSGHSGATERESISHTTETTKDEEKTTKSSDQERPSSPLSDRRPRFRPSLYGSPFYPGHTMYGGASASTYINHPIIKHKPVTVRESHKTAWSELSSATKRIFDLLENCPSPLIEAKRISVFQNLNKSYEQNSQSPNTSKSSSYKTQELVVPSIASIMRLKQRSRMLESSKAARQLIASHSSTEPYLQSYKDSTMSDSTRSTEREGSSKMKLRLTRPNRGEDPLAMPEPVQLPTAVLHIDKDNLPKFSITSPTSSTSVLSTQLNHGTPAFTSNYKPQVTSDTNTTPKWFENPVNSNMPSRASSSSSMFKFASPAASPIAMTQDLQIINEAGKDDQNANEPQGRQEPLQQNTFFVKKDVTPLITSGLQSSKDWKCSDCWVNNKPNLEKCVACGGKRPPGADKIVQGQRAPATVSAPAPAPDANEVEEKDWKCDSCWILNNSSVKKCAACGGSKPSGKEHATAHTSAPSFGVTNSDQDWKCDNCWIKNKSSVKKCAACGGSKPGGKEPTAFISDAPLAKQADEDWKCENCWIKNQSRIKKCAACGGSKPDGKEQENPAPHPGSHSVFYKPPDKKLEEIMSAQKKKWVCSSCLIRNDDDKTKCQCCEMEREGPSKEITSKPYTFPKESNIHFKFGIDPKEQEKNLAKKIDQGANSKLTKLDETNNNNTYVVKFPPLVKTDDNKPGEQKPDGKVNDNKTETGVPEAAKVSFTFGVPKTTQETPSLSAVVPSLDKQVEKPTQVTTTPSFGTGFFAPPKPEQATSPKSFPSFLATSTSIAKTEPQKSTAAPVDVPNNEMKDQNTGFRFADAKPNTFQFGGEKRAGEGSFGASSTNANSAFSFGGTPQSAPAASTGAFSLTFFSGPQTAPPGTLFSSTEPSTSSALATPIFTTKTEGPSVTSTSAFSFGNANNIDNKTTSFGSTNNNNIASPFSFGSNKDNNASPFGSVNKSENASPFGSANNNDNATPFGTASKNASPFGSANNNDNASPFGSASNNDHKTSPFGSTFKTSGAPSAFTMNKTTPLSGGTLEGSSGGMDSSNNGFNEPGSGAANSRFRTGAQESAWSAKGDATFGVGGGGGSAARDPALFSFNAMGNQFGPGSSGSGAGAPTLFGAQPPAAAQNVFGMTGVSSGGLFGAPQSQPAQPAHIFGAQPAPNVFGAQNQPTPFGAPAPTQQATFGAPASAQSTTFGATAPTQPSTFGAQAPAFGASQQNQQPAFGAPTSNQPPAFGASAQNQPPTFGAPAQSQPSAFGAPTSIQSPAFGVQAQPAPTPAFNFGSGVFNFGQQSQTPAQPSSIYSFGGNTMGGLNTSMGGGMLSQPMDGGMGAAGGMGGMGGMGGPGAMGGPGGVHFSVGSAPAAASNARRVRKAVRRNPPR